MGDVVFVRSRTERGSYADYWKLVELNEYPTCYVDEIPRDGVKDKTYIVTPFDGAWENGIQTDGRIIGYDLEWRPDSFPFFPNVDEFWHMDKATADRWGVRYVPVGGDSRLKLDTPVIPMSKWFDGMYDAAYLGYMTGRRQRILHELTEAGLRLPPTSMWGEDRHQCLLHSRSYLHVHQLDNAPGVPGLRLVVAAAYGLPVISEAFADPGVFKEMTLEIGYDYLTKSVKLYTETNSWQEMTSPLTEFLNTEYTFAKAIAAHV